MNNKKASYESKESGDKPDIDMKLNFGKYSGKTVKEVYTLDKNYFNYLKEKAQDQKIIETCKQIEKVN